MQITADTKMVTFMRLPLQVRASYFSFKAIFMENATLLIWQHGKLNNCTNLVYVIRIYQEL